MTGQDLSHFVSYAGRLSDVLLAADWNDVAKLAEGVLECWKTGRHVFICGNGGSAGNAIHLANDFLYGIAKRSGQGLRVTALPANPAVLTCLGNDIGYGQIFSEQLAVLGSAGDLLIVFSGSGNSPNVVEAIHQARRQGIRTYAVLGYSGGVCKDLADVAIHFPIDDMQVSEDLQLIVGHMLMQWLYDRRPRGDA